MQNQIDAPDLLINGQQPVCCVYNGEVVWEPNIVNSYRVYIRWTNETANNICLNGLTCWYVPNIGTTLDSSDIYRETSSSPDASYKDAQNNYHSLSWNQVDDMCSYNGSGLTINAKVITFRIIAYQNANFIKFAFKTGQNQSTGSMDIEIIEYGSNHMRRVVNTTINITSNTEYTFARGTS